MSYRNYYCPKCQIMKHIDNNEKFDFVCKCCGGKMIYKGIVRTEDDKKIPQYIAQAKPVYTPPTVNPSMPQNSESVCVPKCPTCGSTNVQKISGAKRWLTTGLFGLASGDLGKSMWCKNCGYKW